MAKLSLPITHIKPNYTVVVIGSGYGGGIAASRLARAGQQVCLLERGKEFQMGDFPNTLFKANKAMQLDTSIMRLGSKTALFDLRLNKDMNALVGCGLGGTSLINAGVIIETNPHIFDKSNWPKALVDDLKDGIETGYQHAREMLKATPYPKDFPKLKKLEIMEKSAEYLEEEFYCPPIAVTFEKYKEDINHVGVVQQPCILCGDCMSGCNYAAKNTVQMNYLPDAWNHGAEIFTEVKVRYLEKTGKKWLVHFESMGSGAEKFHAPNLFVSADIVILAAGTLGSTEILLRSKQNDLHLSDKLGTHLTGNGGLMAFGYNLTEKVNGIGLGTRQPDPDNPVGPCITGIVDTRKHSKSYEQCMSIEEGTIPGALTPLLPLTFYFQDKLISTNLRQKGWRAYFKAKQQELISLFRGSYHGAMNHTQTYLAITHDSDQGIMHLHKDRLRIQWPGVGKEKVFQNAQNNFKRMTTAIGGSYIPNPIWTKLFGYKLITVHPLGGCFMSEDASNGVTNHKGQVFAGNQGEEIHQGLYISDGSIIPTTLGTNPILTISAISERNIALLAKERGWTLSYDLPSKPIKKATQSQIGFQFTETMLGYFSTKETEDYKLAAKLGKEESSKFEFTLTILSEDIQEMLKNEEHQANMFGTVSASALSDKPLMVTEGVFNLFVKYDANIQRMRYRMKLHAQDGKSYYFDGVKKIRHTSIFSIWGDTTTLYITVYDGEKTAVLGKGIIKIRLIDFLKQMLTLKVINAAGKFEALKYTAQFGKFFTSKLVENYGGIFGGWDYFKADAPPRQKRPLRVSAPEVHEFITEDKVKLRLTRYKGGSKGPVILTHGAGVSSRIFSMDTVDTNLLEYLFANNYDVWLLDYRASIELSSVHTQFSADDVAKYDYPAAVDTVLKITGAESVQFVAHCYGASILTMSLLGGWLKGVRSVVCSQVSTHNKVPFLTKIKTSLYAPTFFSLLGIKSLTAYVANNSKWWERAFNMLLALFHPVKKGERCHNPVCYRIAFMYGQLYEHGQLNKSTHDNMHELFGMVNMTTLKHLALMVRKGHLVNAQGEDCYLPHLERMAIPVTFISGEENKCFLPESTEITYSNLCEKNGKDLYKRVVIPNYGHIDCIFGKNAVRDVYPSILNHLEETN